MMADQTQKPDNSEEEAERFLKRAARAENNLKKVAAIIDDCYEFCLPLRQRTYLTSAASKRTERLFDSTGQEALKDYASQALDDVWPADSKPFELVAGSDVDPQELEEVNRLLDEVAEQLIFDINHSNFRASAHEAFLDYGIGTGYLLPEEGDAVDPLNFKNIPLTQAWPDMGPRGSCDALFHKIKVRAGGIEIRFPGANLSEELSSKVKNSPDEELEVIIGWERDWKEKNAETWVYRAVASQEKHILLEEKISGFGSKPFIDFSPMRATGEVIGRGVAQIALPDIETVNVVKQLLLENADIQIGGMWQAENDGVLNVDNITIAPGTIIPKMKGSKGLEPIAPPGDVRLADIVIENLQTSIRRVFQTDELGPPTGTPASATEIMQRTVNQAKRNSGEYGRKLMEFLTPLVRRVAYIRQKQGAIKLPRIDGRQVLLRPMSPMTRAQAQDEILRHDRVIEMVSARFGPQVTHLLVDAEKYSAWLAEASGFKPTLLRGQLERKQLAQSIAQAVAAANQGEEL